MIASLFLALTLTANIRQIAAKTEAIVGVAAFDFETGRSLTIRGDEAFPTASVFKFPLAVEVLHRVDAGTMRLDERYVIKPSDFRPAHSPVRDRAKGKPVTLTLRELLRFTVAESDNTTADYLLRIVTPAAVNARARGFHIEMEEIRDTATPSGALELLRKVHERRDGLKPASHDFLMSILTNSQNPVRIAKLLPSGAKVAHKTGTMQGTLNDIGIVTSPDGKHTIAIAIFTKGATRSSTEARERMVAEIARAIYDVWAR